MESIFPPTPNGDEFQDNLHSMMGKIATQMTGTQERAIMMPLVALLGRTPTIEDLQNCSRIFDARDCNTPLYEQYDFYYKETLLGKMILEFHPHYRVRFIPSLTSRYVICN